MSAKPGESASRPEVASAVAPPPGRSGDTAPSASPSGANPVTPGAAPAPFAGALTKELRDGDLDKPMEMVEFMFQLGLHYHLPGREEGTVDPVPEAKARGTRWWLPTVAVVAVLAAAGMQLLRPRPERTLPREVLGEWRTLSRSYAGRGFKLSPDRVALDFGEIASSVEFPISEVHREARGDTTVFEVLYRQDRGQTRVVFKYVETGRPTVFLLNPGGVAWVRATDVGYDSPPLYPPTAPPRQPSGVAPPYARVP